MSNNNAAETDFDFVAGQSVWWNDTDNHTFSGWYRYVSSNYVDGLSLIETDKGHGVLVNPEDLSLEAPKAAEIALDLADELMGDAMDAADQAENPGDFLQSSMDRVVEQLERLVSSPDQAVQQDFSMTLLNETGDITLTWSDGEDQAIREMIQKKIDQGYSFFRIEPKFCGLIKRKVRVTDVDQLSANTITLKDKDAARILSDADLSAVFRDNDAAELFASGKVGAAELSGKDSNEIPVGARLKTADEVMKAQTIAVRPMMGG